MDIGGRKKERKRVVEKNPKIDQEGKKQLANR